MLPGLAPSSLPADAVEVGRILDAWGIKGWFKVLPYSATPEALFSCKLWYLLPTEKGVPTFTGCGSLQIIESKYHSDTIVACAQSVIDRAVADSLRGARIFIPKSSFPAVSPDEYYWVDLIGLEVTNREGQSLGHVTELLSTGPQTVLVIEDSAPDKPTQRMIPFVAHYIDEVSVSQRRIRVDWQLDY
ncbi:ribosome maturation factor RimM [Rhodoferax sp.]|uniref:ribosome maturation factor RimM n=1 Tax=Rhodoferax sp. TaxID=50421 RepID=UPI002605200B|nr:ribosome maturation factor RimM [Rhodoferax sp.]MDD2810408.1 ribosome maturation factor RimM [Rhodoferax sp.]